MKKKAFFPILLAVWPYISVILLYLLAEVSDKLYWLIFAAIVISTVVIYTLNIINACTHKNERADEQLAFWDMLVKLIHIPFYLGVFFIGVVFLLAMVVPMFVMVSPLIVIMLAVIDFFLMLTSSAYGINAVARARQKGSISTGFLVLNIIMHLLFVTDVISAVIVFVKLKMNKR